VVVETKKSLKEKQKPRRKPEGKLGKRSRRRIGVTLYVGRFGSCGDTEKRSVTREGKPERRIPVLQTEARLVVKKIRG